MGIENKVACATIAARNFIKKHLDVKITLAGVKHEIEKTFLFKNEFEILATDEYIKQSDNILTGLRKINSSFVLSFLLMCGKSRCFKCVYSRPSLSSELTLLLNHLFFTLF